MMDYSPVLNIFAVTVKLDEAAYGITFLPGPSSLAQTTPESHRIVSSEPLLIHKRPIRDVQFSPSGMQCLAVSLDKSATMSCFENQDSWFATKLKIVFPAAVWCGLWLSEDSIVVGLANGEVRLWTRSLDQSEVTDDDACMFALCKLDGPVHSICRIERLDGSVGVFCSSTQSITCIGDVSKRDTMSMDINIYSCNSSASISKNDCDPPIPVARHVFLGYDIESQYLMVIDVAPGNEGHYHVIMRKIVSWKKNAASNFIEPIFEELVQWSAHLDCGVFKKPTMFSSSSATDEVCVFGIKKEEFGNDMLTVFSNSGDNLLRVQFDQSSEQSTMVTKTCIHAIKCWKFVNSQLVAVARDSFLTFYHQQDKKYISIL